MQIIQKCSLYFVHPCKVLHMWHLPVEGSNTPAAHVQNTPMYPFVQPCTKSVQLAPTCLAAAVHAVLLRPTYSSSSYGSKAASARKATGFTLIQPGNNKRICSKCNCYQRIQKNQTKKSIRLKCRHSIHGFQDNKNKFYFFGEVRCGGQQTSGVWCHQGVRQTKLVPRFCCRWTGQSCWQESCDCDTYDGGDNDNMTISMFLRIWWY